MNDDALLVEVSEGIATLTMNRPAARNALSAGLMAALAGALERAGADRQVRVVVIAAAGPAFCAGHDLRELRSEPHRAMYERVFAQCSELMLQIVHLPKPVIAEYTPKVRVSSQHPVGSVIGTLVKLGLGWRSTWLRYMSAPLPE